MTGTGAEKLTTTFEYRVGSPIGIWRHRRRLGLVLCPSLMGIVTANSSKKELKAKCNICKRPANIDWGQEHKNRMALYE